MNEKLLTTLETNNFIFDIILKQLDEWLQNNPNSPFFDEMFNLYLQIPTTKTIGDIAKIIKQERVFS